MSNQRIDASQGYYPSLFEKATTVEAASKTISILSAATGRDSINAAPHKKNVSPRILSVGALAAAGLIGVAYWHFNIARVDGTEDRLMVTQRVSTASATVRSAENSAPNAARLQPPPARERNNTAVVEQVKVSSVESDPLPAPVVNPRLYKKSPTAKPASPLRSVESTSKRKAPQASGRPVEKSNAGSANNITSVAYVQKDPPTRSVASDQQSVVMVRSATDADVKLLEGMLRLMRRDETQGSSAAHTTK